MANTFNQLNASNYVINVDGYIEVPSINFNVRTGTQEQLTAEITRYDGAVITYKSAYQTALANRTYIPSMFAKDLAAAADFLTEKGINKEENTVKLHVKADNIYLIATENTDLYNYDGIATVINRYQQLNNEIALTDDASDSALVETYGTEETYDTKAITITALTLTDAIFLNDVANASGNNRTFTNYTTTLAETEGARYENTPQYVISFVQNYNVSENETINAWVIRAYSSNPETENPVLAYTEDSIDDNSITWITVTESSSSSAEE